MRGVFAKVTTALLPSLTLAFLPSFRALYRFDTGIKTSSNMSPQSSAIHTATDLLPTMIVFDLDDCLWSPEMYTLHAQPSIPEFGDLGDGETGVVGLKVPPAGPTVRLFPGARQVLRELATDPKYANVIIASASSSEEPSFSYACLRGIEVLPGLTMDKMFRYNQIGRTGALTSDKKTHFKLLHQESRVPYEEMLFFDDCNWGDHCGRVSREFGVISQRTPSGLHHSEFVQGLNSYKKAAQERGSR
jgi:magnesium-dependent phosphatase 1